jgi:hypothetical protein
MTMRSTLGPLILPEHWWWPGYRASRKRMNRAYQRLRRILRAHGPLGVVHFETRPEVLGAMIDPALALQGMRLAPPQWGLSPGAAYLRQGGVVVIRERGQLYGMWRTP